jgi:hypothetical protein
MSYRMLSIFFTEISIKLTIKWEFVGAVLVSLTSPQWVQVQWGSVLSFRPILWELLDFEELFSLKIQ